MFKLVISDDEGQTTVVPLLRDEITIGREEGNTIRLTERNVSRNHARLLKRNGSYILEDLGSYNGVTVNGERIDDSVKLLAGDQLGIGDYALDFQADVAPTAATLPAPKPKSSPPPRLLLLSEPAAGAEFSLAKPVLRVGRDERLDIWINHKSISHEHAEIQVHDGKVTVFDLESANGLRVNGIDASRAVLESGDVLELGAVRFRFLLAEGTHSLEELPEETPPTRRPPAGRKLLFALSVLLLLAVVGGAAVVATMSGREYPVAGVEPPAVSVAAPPEAMPERAVQPQPTALAPPTEVEAGTQPGAEPVRADLADSKPDPDAETEAIEEPQEWEDQLSRARGELATGRIDDAYAIADELPADSVLRKTPEFGEIRYRYAQAHIAAGKRALRAGDEKTAGGEAKLVLALGGITSRQRQEAKRLLSRARRPKVSPEEALAQAHECVARGDNACVIQSLEGGQARSPAALALLIETYRAMDDLPAARRHMRAFVARYPNNPRTPRYREMLRSD